MGLLWSDADFKRARRAIRKIERMPRPEEFLQDSPRQIVPNVYVRVIGEGSGGGGIASGEEGLATLLRRVDGSWEETVWTWRIVNQTGRTLQEGEDVIADWESQSGHYVVWSDSAEPLFAARTTGTTSNIVLESSVVYGDRWLIKLNSTIHRRPDDATIFSLDTTYYEVSVAQSGFYSFAGWVYFEHDNDDLQRPFWLEESDAGAYDVGAAWTEIFGTRMWPTRVSGGDEKRTVTFYVERLLSAAKKYRIGTSGGYSPDPTVNNGVEARLNIQRLSLFN